MKYSDKYNDLSLFRRIKADDRQAFNQVFDTCYEELCDFAFMILNQKEAAEEVVADVLANIWIKRKQLMITTALRPYLYKSTKNRAISYLRRKKKVVDLDEIIHFIPNTDITPEQKLISSENLETIDCWLDAIPGKSRLVFKMHRIENMKYREIADSLEISIKTVEKHMGKALKILRQREEKKQHMLQDIRHMNNKDN